MFTYVYPNTDPNVGKYSIHGASGYVYLYVYVQFNISYELGLSEDWASPIPIAIICQEIAIYAGILPGIPHCSDSSQWAI